MADSFLKRYRFENFIREFDRFMKANLDTYIDQMNTDLTDIVLLKPSRIAQVETFTPTVADMTTYSLTVDGVSYAFTSGAMATAATIVAGLIAKIGEHVDRVVTATGVVTLTLTANVPGVEFRSTAGSGLTKAAVTPSSSAYIFQTFTGTDAPYSVFVFYGEALTQVRNSGDEAIDGYVLQVALVLENLNEAQGVTGFRLLRYRDILKRVFLDGWNSVNKRVKLDVSGLSPFLFSVQNEDASHIGIGVTITMELP